MQAAQGQIFLQKLPARLLPIALHPYNHRRILEAGIDLVKCNVIDAYVADYDCQFMFNAALTTCIGNVEKGAGIAHPIFQVGCSKPLYGPAQRYSDCPGVIGLIGMQPFSQHCIAVVSPLDAATKF